MFKKLVCALFLAVALAGCGNSVPTDEEMMCVLSKEQLANIRDVQRTLSYARQRDIILLKSGRIQLVLCTVSDGECWREFDPDGLSGREGELLVATSLPSVRHANFKRYRPKTERLYELGQIEEVVRGDLSDTRYYILLEKFIRQGF